MHMQTNMQQALDKCAACERRFSDCGLKLVNLVFVFNRYFSLVQIIQHDDVASSSPYGSSYLYSCKRPERR